MSPLQVALPVFGLSQCLIILIVLLRDCRRYSQARIFTLLLLCCPAYLIYPLAANLSLPYRLGVESIRTALPGMVWLVSYSLFTERFRLKPWHWLIVAFTVTLPLIGGLLGGRELFREEGRSLEMWLWWHIPQWTEVLLLSHACYLLLSRWRGDLVEARRSLRVLVVGMVVAYTATVVFVEQMLGNNSKVMDWRLFVVFDLLLVALNMVLLQWRHTELFVEPEQATAMRNTAASTTAAARGLELVADNSATSSTPPAEEPRAADIARLTELMEAGIYRRHGLTIGELAEELDWQEYRLRRLINGQLGYRNFNDFLNQYRIAEAARRLRNPADDQLPVLTIALDTGYRSLSSFNKAFKEAFGLTPTSYRKTQLGTEAECKTS
jgi:AraC-like DNA-binding protein